MAAIVAMAEISPKRRAFMTPPFPDRSFSVGDYRRLFRRAPVVGTLTALKRHFNAHNATSLISGAEKKNRDDRAVHRPFRDRSTDVLTSLYVMTLLASAGCFVALGFFLSENAPSLSTLTLLMLTALIAERQSVRLAPAIEISVAFFPILFTAVIFGGFWAGIVGAAGLSLHVGRPYLRWTSWVSTRIIAATAAGLVAQSSQYSASRSLATLTLSAIAAVLAYVFLDITIGAMTLAVRKTAQVAKLIKMTILIGAVSILLYAPIIAVLAYAYLEAPKWTLLLFVAPAFVTQRLFILYRTQRETSDRLFDAITKLESVNVSFATALVTALDARDHYTAGHSAAVAVYARDIAKYLGLTEEQQKRAHLCGLLHDIGKIGVPTGVLEKEGPLLEEERRSIEAHAVVGAAILRRIEEYEEIASAVYHHHERYDGEGYPDRIKNDGIPVLARLVAVADAYSAMTSERPYRTALSSDEARERIERESGKQFDPTVVEAFVAVLEDASEAYAYGTDKNFEIEVSELATLELGRSPALASDASLV
jgi:putative nucleotidyltransferase with HDIG domain